MQWIIIIIIIATNIPMLLMTGFVVQGHIWIQLSLELTHYESLK